MIPISVSEERMSNLASVFDCQIGTLPFTYLGLPLDTTKQRVQDFAPLIDRVERCLVACSEYLSYGGLLIMVNAVLSCYQLTTCVF